MSGEDNFISYEHLEKLKFEKEFESDKFDDEFSADTESTGIFHPNFSNNNLYYFDNGLQLTYESNEYMNNRSYNPKQPFNIIRNCRGQSSDIQVKLEPADRVLTKTKRIMKREKAKQRVMIKQESCAMSDISSKQVPEALNDLDLDDKSKKKMIQMIRNRISAQNSRDRKKQYVQQLEASQIKLAEDHMRVNDKYRKLQEENRKLISQNAMLMEENMRLKSANFTCPSCGSTSGSSEGSPLQSPPSPNYNVFSGSPKNRAFASLFCLATIISCLMYNNLASQGINLPVPNSTGLQPYRVLEETNDMVKTEGKRKFFWSEISEADPCFVKMESDLHNFGDSILKNIKPLKEEFKANHLAVYQELQKKQSFCIKESQPAVKIEEDEHAVVDYRPTVQSFLGKENESKKNLPVLSNSQISREPYTILVHNAVKLSDEEEKRGGLDEEFNKNDFKENDFVQLVVPVNSVRELNMGKFVHSFSNMINNGASDDGKMLELWVKVFFVRELSANNF